MEWESHVTLGWKSDVLLTSGDILAFMQMLMLPNVIHLPNGLGFKLFGLSRVLACEQATTTVGDKPPSMEQYMNTGGLNCHFSGSRKQMRCSTM